MRELLDAAEHGDRVAGPAWAGFRPLRVTGIVRESGTVSSIYLAAADGTRLPAAQAGQYLTLRIPGADTPAPVRSYSLSSAPAAGGYRISIKRERDGSASDHLTTKLEPGTVLDAAAPRVDFVLDDGDGPVLLISAGIGLTPVLSMPHELAADHSEREVWWMHGARGRGEHPLAAEVHAMLAPAPQRSRARVLQRGHPSLGERYKRQAKHGRSIKWQPGGPILLANNSQQVVPCSWQMTRADHAYGTRVGNHGMRDNRFTRVPGAWVIPPQVPRPLREGDAGAPRRPSEPGQAQRAA